MLAEWSAECSPDDPVLVVPWKDPNGQAAFVDLRANPYDFDAIPEAEHYPPLMQALRALNAGRSPVFSAKCDAWPMDSDELDHLQLNLDASSSDEPSDRTSGFASYIDLVARERSVFTSLPQNEQMLLRLTRLAAQLDYPAAALECVLRPALIDLEGPQQGYAFSLYVKALGVDSQDAIQEWGAGLDAVIALIRSKEFSR
jgi:hypothetical protein